jgi:hypothetical protein
MEVAIAAAVVSAIGSVREGYQRQQAYQEQAAMARLQTESQLIESERRAIQYEIQGNNILRRINQASAAVSARAYAGGTMGFEGSAALVATQGEKQGAREFGYATEGAASTRRIGLVSAKLGELQADQYIKAGETAVESGWFSAAGKLGSAYMSGSKIGGPQQAPAPVYEKSVEYRG